MAGIQDPPMLKYYKSNNVCHLQNDAVLTILVSEARDLDVHVCEQLYTLTAYS